MSDLFAAFIIVVGVGMIALAIYDRFTVHRDDLRDDE